VKGNSNAGWMDRILFASFEKATYVGLSFYRWIGSAALDDIKWSNCFSEYPVTALFERTRQIPREGSLPELVSAFERRPEHRGLLVPLVSGLMTVDYASRQALIRRISSSSADSIAVNAAVLAMNIMYGVSIGELEGEIASALLADERLLRVLVRAIGSRELSYDVECRELMSLLRIGDPDHSVVWRALYRNFARRPSWLLREGTWEHLELPATMRRLLDT
jgi:hypothetical protein